MEKLRVKKNTDKEGEKLTIVMEESVSWIPTLRALIETKEKQKAMKQKEKRRPKFIN